MARLLRARSLVLIAAFVLAACSGSTSAPQHSPSPIAGALNDGLIAYVSSQGVGVIDPGTGKSLVVAPLPQGGAFRVAGPAWGPPPPPPQPPLLFPRPTHRAPTRPSRPPRRPFQRASQCSPFSRPLT